MRKAVHHEAGPFPLLGLRRSNKLAQTNILTLWQTTQVCLSPFIKPGFLLLTLTIVSYYSSKQPQGWPWRYCNDHWEPEDRDRERRSEVGFPGPLTLMLRNILSFLTSTTLAPAFSALSLSFPSCCGVAWLHPTTGVRPLNDPEAALHAAIHATAIVSHRRHSCALSVGR
jgi:hypothetical protein